MSGITDRAMRNALTLKRGRLLVPVSGRVPADAGVSQEPERCADKNALAWRAGWAL